MLTLMSRDIESSIDCLAYVTDYYLRAVHDVGAFIPPPTMAALATTSGMWSELPHVDKSSTYVSDWELTVRKAVPELDELRRIDAGLHHRS